MNEDCKKCQLILSFQKLVKHQEEQLKKQEREIFEFRKRTQIKIDFNLN